MSDDWDFYLCAVDDQAASIFLDLGVAAEAPLPGLRHLAWVRVTLRSPRPDGLSSQEEFETLSRLEDHLTGRLAEDRATVYVGRCTTGGCRDFHFYVSDPRDWDMRVASAMAAHPEYEAESGSQDDPEWRTYFGFLHPSPEDLAVIRNRRVCLALQQHGDTLTAPREIDHWAYFPDESARARFVREVEALGFAVRDTNHIDGSERPFGIQFFRVDTPDLETIDDLTVPLEHAAREQGGEYDGWESQVIA